MTRRGSALMVVLWVLAVLVVVCLAIGSSVRFRQVSLRRARSDLCDSQAMLSALARAMAVLRADPTAEDTLRDSWATDDSGRFSFQVSQREVELRACQGDSPRSGLTDEAARINVNVADADTIAALPGMTQAAAEALTRIREQVIAADPGRIGGAFETEAELLALLDEALEAGGLAYGRGARAATFWPANTGISEAALQAARHMTLHSRERNLDAAGRPRVNLNRASQEELGAALGEHLTARQVEAIVLSRRETPFESIGELLTRELTVPDEEGQPEAVEISLDAFRRIADRLTVTEQAILIGLVNVNTAPAEVLQALPELESADAEAIVEARERDEDRSSLAWLLEVLTPETFAACCNRLTTRSQQFRMCARVAESDGTARSATAVLERDGGRCVVLEWTTWQGAAEPVR